jgi:hypothetical protein
MSHPKGRMCVREFEDRALRLIIGSKRKEVEEQWRKVWNEKHH